MRTMTPAVLIGRHIEKLRRSAGPEKIDQVLAQTDLISDGAVVKKPGGSEVTVSDCQKYKQAVRAVCGDAVYSFAKVNFVLGGCTCDDCRE
jgi:hypothetical protein